MTRSRKSSKGDLQVGDEIIIGEETRPGHRRPHLRKRSMVVTGRDVVIEVKSLTRTFIVGDVEVRALRGVNL